jgi:hypothetical protein
MDFQTGFESDLGIVAVSHLAEGLERHRIGIDRDDVLGC